MGKMTRRLLEHCEFTDAPQQGREAIRSRREPDAVRIRRAWESPDGPGVGLDPLSDRLAIRPLFGRCWWVTRLETSGDGLTRREVAHESYFVTVADAPPRIVFVGRGHRYAVES